MSAVVVAVIVGALSGIGSALVAASTQRRKVSAEVELTAAETAAIVLKELRAEREDLRRQITDLQARQERDHEANQAAIAELRAAEYRCQRRLVRAIEVMRANGLAVPPDLNA